MVLPPSVGARLAVEAGVPQGWHSYAGERGEALGMEHFCASAPADVLLRDVLLREYGFTTDHVCARATALSR